MNDAGEVVGYGYFQATGGVPFLRNGLGRPRPARR
jgi:hypothetical protein